jgi:hypothetical protein
VCVYISAHVRVPACSYVCVCMCVCQIWFGMLLQQTNLFSAAGEGELGSIVVSFRAMTLTWDDDLHNITSAAFTKLSKFVISNVSIYVIDVLEQSRHCRAMCMHCGSLYWMIRMSVAFSFVLQAIVGRHT